jgi:hypothetical protein
MTVIVRIPLNTSVIMVWPIRSVKRFIDVFMRQR